MGIGGRSLALALLAFVIATAVCAGSEPITLREAKPVARGIAAFPNVAAPKSEATARINRALEGADASVDRLAVDCNHYKNWRRTIAVAMRGPHYLSLVASDDWYCGAYPDTGTTALVYDLATGAPIDWAKLFPPKLVPKAAPSPGGGVSDPLYVLSDDLWDAFVTAAKANKPDDDCNQVRENPAGLDKSLMMWPDAKADGIEIAPAQFPHAIRVCAVPVTVPTAELRKLGVDAALLDAIDEAHAKGWYDEEKK